MKSGRGKSEDSEMRAVNGEGQSHIQNNRVPIALKRKNLAGEVDIEIFPQMGASQEGRAIHNTPKSWLKGKSEGSKQGRGELDVMMCGGGRTFKGSKGKKLGVKLSS